MNAVTELVLRTIRKLGADRVAYLIVSIIALAIDFLVTLNLTWAGIAPALAATAGYVLGLGVHWALSVRFVFAAEVSRALVARRRQAAMFVVSGLIGLSVTIAAYSGAIALGAAPSISKAFAVALSFLIVYLIRRHVVFPQRA